MTNASTMRPTLLTNLRLAAMTADRPYGLLEDAAIAISDGRVLHAGPSAELAETYRAFERRDLGGRLVTPALIDCHTHLVFAGNRAGEFEMRLNGARYEEIAHAGGGIVSTVAATRATGVDELVEDALPRLDALIAEGVATVEIKSGYGLTVEDELKMLRAARRLGELRPVRVVTSYLAAHALPPDYAGRRAAYLDEVVLPGMEKGCKEGLIDAVDGFCETIAFTREEMARVFDAAARLGLPVKLHAEQLSNSGGARLAAERGALSADHLEYLEEEGAVAMAAAGTVAVLLPGAFYTLREERGPPVDLLRKHGVAMALATDCNPGSSPLASLLLAVNMGCTLFRMTPEEALCGATREAARALGLADEIGTVEAGRKAELAVWDVEHPAELAYRIGFNSLHERLIA